MLRVDIVGSQVDIHESRDKPVLDNRIDRRWESCGNGDDFVTGAYASGLQGNDQRISAGVHADGMFNAEVLGRFLFKGSDV